MAAQGMRPFCAIYSTFLQRAYDQVVHDVAIQNLPVRFAIDRAGLVGADGATHAGSFDVTYLASLPNMVVMAAADEAELVHMVHTCVNHDSGPIAVRYPRGNGVGVALPETPELLEIGKGRLVREGKKVAILSLGTRLGEALRAADALEAKGLSTSVADLRFAQPLDEALIRRLLTTHEVAVTIEENAIGGLGAHVLTMASDEGLIDAGLKLSVPPLQGEVAGRRPDGGVSRYRDGDTPPPCCAWSPSPCRGGIASDRTCRSGVDRDHAASDLIQLDAFEQGLEIAVAKAFIALALDDLEEDRADHILGEDLEQDALFADISVDQDTVALQPIQILAMARHALVDQFVIGLDRILQPHAARAQLFDRLVNIFGGQCEVLDAFAIIFANEFLDLALLVLALVKGDADRSCRSRSWCATSRRARCPSVWASKRA